MKAQPIPFLAQGVTNHKLEAVGCKPDRSHALLML